MTPAAHHPALVAAVEALERCACEPGDEECLCGLRHAQGLEGECRYCAARSALALLRAAMSNAETAWLMRHNKGGTWPVLMDEDDGDSVRVTVLRWEE